jgi:uncharacterized protein (DUF4415 family)
MKPSPDPDDAPELDEEFFDKGVWKIGERVVSRAEGSKAAATALRRGRPKAEQTKLSLTVRYDADIIEAFKASGPGWQTRMNAALREWLKTHHPA